MAKRLAARRAEAGDASDGATRQTRRAKSTEQRRPADDGAQIMTVNEASRRYAGEWVLMKITGFDENHGLKEGVVVCHSRSRARISRYDEKVHNEDPTALCFVFPAGGLHLTPEETRELMDAAARGEYVNARW